MSNLDCQESIHVDLSKQDAEKVKEMQDNQYKKSNFQKYAESNSVGGL